jgi:hypothetical protein
MANCIIAQSGGPTSVINSSVVGLVDANKELKIFDKVYAGLNGIEGILNGNIIELSSFNDKEINSFRYTPSSGLGSCRYKMKKLEESTEEYDKLLFVGNLTGESLFLDFFKVGKDYALQTARKQIINKNAHLVFSECGEWGVCEYYYSNKLSNYTIVKGKKVNIHIAYGKNSLTIGTPLIYGSF